MSVTFQKFPTRIVTDRSSFTCGSEMPAPSSKQNIRKLTVETDHPAGQNDPEQDYWDEAEFVILVLSYKKEAFQVKVAGIDMICRRKVCAEERGFYIKPPNFQGLLRVAEIDVAENTRATLHVSVLEES